MAFLNIYKCAYVWDPLANLVTYYTYISMELQTANVIFAQMYVPARKLTALDILWVADLQVLHKYSS